MLTSTFVLLNGIGVSTERRLWQTGIRDWSTFLHSPSLSGISVGRKSVYDVHLSTAQAHLDAGHARYFATCLKSRDHWRLLNVFRARVLYLDIETNGMPVRDGYVTVVGMYRNGQMISLVRGENLTEERLRHELDQTDLLVTFFGSGFDIPYLRAKFPRLDFRMPHFDLCFAARRLGFTGGLKYIEQDFEIEREPAITGLDGWEAVRLWQQWKAGDETALDLLLRYNAADTRNLEPLAEQLYRQMVIRFGPTPVTIEPNPSSEVFA